MDEIKSREKQRKQLARKVCIHSSHQTISVCQKPVLVMDGKLDNV